MPTFLQICQYVAQESGVIPNLPAPLSVTGQTGKLQRIVSWVDSAYRHVQNSQDSWKWMHGDFEAPLIASLASYSGSDLGLTRHARWHGLNTPQPTWTIRAPGTTRDTEQRLQYVSADYFDSMLDIGIVQTGAPTIVAIGADDKVRLHPTPDDAYIVRGKYYKSPQALLLDGDVPEMPARFHDAIQWRALILLGTFDETPTQIQNWNAFYNEVIGQAQSSQLPQVTKTGALA